MTKKTFLQKTKLSFIFLLLIISAEVIYLNYLQTKESNTTYKNMGPNKSCNKYTDLRDKQKCWEDLIENTLKKEGLDYAFNVVDYLYTSEPQFASDCHGFTHLLGEKAYELFAKNQKFNVSNKASYCGFGFYHSFMENLLRTTGDLNQARKFCDEVGKKPNQNEVARLSCFHGIGHGLLEDIPNPILKGNAKAIIEEPLAICAELSRSEAEIYRCASGVFNVLAIYYANPKAGLKVDKVDPYSICHNQPRRAFKESCYYQMNTFVFSLAQGDLSKSAKFTKSIQEDDLVNAAMNGLAEVYGDTWVSKINYDDVVKICQNLEPRLTSSCLEGFLEGLLEGGKPEEEFIEGRKFCNNHLLNDQQKASCFGNLTWNTGATNPKKLAELCNSIEQKYQQNCTISQN